MSEKKYKVRDALGREFEVPMSAVRRDYVDFLKKADDLTEDQAQKHADEYYGIGGWNEYWFYEQMADELATIQRVGVMTKDVTEEKIKSVLEWYARQGSIDVIGE